MGQDRFVWTRRGCATPTPTEVGRALRRYLGPLGVASWSRRHHRFFVDVKGGGGEVCGSGVIRPGVAWSGSDAAAVA